MHGETLKFEICSRLQGVYNGGHVWLSIYFSKMGLIYTFHCLFRCEMDDDVQGYY